MLYPGCHRSFVNVVCKRLCTWATRRQAYVTLSTQHYATEVGKANGLTASPRGVLIVAALPPYSRCSSPPAATTSQSATVWSAGIAPHDASSPAPACAERSAPKLLRANAHAHTQIHTCTRVTTRHVTAYRIVPWEKGSSFLELIRRRLF